MLQLKSLILNLLLLVLGILPDLSPDVGFKGSGFSEVVLEKGIEFVLSRRDGIIVFNLGLVLLPAEVDPTLGEQDRKRYALRARGTRRVKIVLILLTKIVALHIKATIIEVGIPGLEGAISKDGVYFAIFLANNKRF